MQIAANVDCEPIKEIGQQFSLQIPDMNHFYLVFVYQRRSPTKINGHNCQWMKRWPVWR